jgi:hypothetical protein
VWVYFSIRERRRWSSALGRRPSAVGRTVRGALGTKRLGMTATGAPWLKLSAWAPPNGKTDSWHRIFGIDWLACLT